MVGISMMTERFLLLTVIPYLCGAFAPSKPNFGLKSDINYHGLVSTFDLAPAKSVTALSMAGNKKRRRRKAPLPNNDAPTGDSTNEVEDEDDDLLDVSSDDDGTLPDFEFDEFAPPKSEPSSSARSSTSSRGAGMAPSIDSGSGMDSPRWLDAMRGGAEENVDISPSDLLRRRDKSLEQSLSRFQDEKETLPTRTDAKKKRKGLAGFDESDGANLSKKRARSEARRAAAIAAEEEEKSGENPLKRVDAFLGEDGEVSPLKVLESGAWAGIYILVAWEFYINSPFFDRAGPMAPVVFQ